MLQTARAIVEVLIDLVRLAALFMRPDSSIRVENFHSAVGCAVTLMCAKRRVPCSMTTTRTTSGRFAVTATKKSQAMIALAWFFNNTDQR
jgi:hypothetical protein